jgi:hypothetical protein
MGCFRFSLRRRNCVSLFLADHFPLILATSRSAALFGRSLREQSRTRYSPLGKQVKKGITPRAQDIEGQVPRQIARRSGDYSKCRLLPQILS